jgi:hypothetical protein
MMDFSNPLQNRRLTVESSTLPSGRTQYMAHDLDTGLTFEVSESMAQEINRNNEEVRELRNGLTRRLVEAFSTPPNPLNANFDNDEAQNNPYTITSIQPRSGDEPILYSVQNLTTGRSFRTYSLQNIEQQLNAHESEVSRRRIGPIANANYEEFTNPFGNLEQIQELSDDLHQLAQLSYETLVKRLYGLPVEMPQFLIVNGLKLNFIPFSEVSKIQIDRYIIEPLLQPWSGPPSSPNRIITIFAKNGMTYLVKAKYDQVSNQIFQPV